MAVPTHSKYLVIGAGIHGLSGAYHLALELKSRGSDEDILADSNHGYKMLGVGKFVAGEICATESELLKPFRFSRCAEGKLHPVSNSPFPWS